jgi:hypothetical protein
MINFCMPTYGRVQSIAELIDLAKLVSVLAFRQESADNCRVPSMCRDIGASARHSLHAGYV